MILTSQNGIKPEWKAWQDTVGFHLNDEAGKPLYRISVTAETYGLATTIRDRLKEVAEMSEPKPVAAAMSDKPAVTDEMVKRLSNVVVQLRNDTAEVDVLDADAIEAVLKEREELKADVERLRKACQYVSKRIHSVPSALPPGTDMGLIQTELYNALAETEPDHIAEAGEMVDEDQRALDAEHNALEDHEHGIGRNPLG